MADFLPVDAQLYLVSLLVGVSVPLVICWHLYEPLTEFLKSIFRNPGIERFWMRVVVLVFFTNCLAAAVGFQPVDVASQDYIALIWNLADQVQWILYAVVWSVFGLFLPLLIAFTVLHFGRDRHVTDPTEGKG